VIAWALLIAAALSNVVRDPASLCPYVKNGIYACAGVLALAATALGITSFSMLRRQPVAPAAAVVGAGAPNKPGEQSPPPAIVVMGQPLFPQASTPEPQQPSESHQVPPNAAHPREYGEAPQNPQSPPPAAARDNGPTSHASNQEFPAQERPADAAAAPPAVASAPPEAGRPGELPPPPPLGVAVGQPVAQLPLHQLHVPNVIPAPQVGVEIRVC
jgi:hypothetical protein